MIYATEVVQDSNQRAFTEALDRAVTGWQEQGCGVEVQYRPVDGGGRYSIRHVALVVAHRRTMPVPA
jgi:hypothetical protein